MLLTLKLSCITAKMKVVWLFQLVVTLMLVLSCECEVGTGKFHFDVLVTLTFLCRPVCQKTMLHVVVLILYGPNVNRVATIDEV